MNPLRQSFLLLSLVVLLARPAGADAPTSSIEERMRRLEERQEQLESELESKDRRIEELERKLGHQAPAVEASENRAPVAKPAPAAPAAVPAPVAAGPAVVPAPEAGGAVVQATPPTPSQAEEEVGVPKEKVQTVDDEYQTWGAIDPGKGFEVANTPYGNLAISGYGLVRYINQLPANQNFVDHLGRKTAVDTREDITFHRVLIHLKGWVYSRNFRYVLTTWTVNSLETVRVIGALGYEFDPRLSIWGGVGALPGTRTMQGSHPLWLAHDRVMADEYFRPGFTQGIWAEGELVKRLRYKFMISNNLSALGVNSSELTRDFAYGLSFNWMPTTGEFGPQGAYGDFENHLHLATRFGASYTISPDEDRNSQPGANSPDNTQIRIGDSQLLFATGTFGDNITVQKARYQMAAIDAGLKYRGLFLQAEAYYRRLDQFQSVEPDIELPITSLEDWGFYLQSSAMVLPELAEIYASTSFVFTDGATTIDDKNLCWEWIVGANWYPFRSRYQRLNLQFIDVTRSPTSSDFGFYKGGLHGYVLTVAASVDF